MQKFLAEKSADIYLSVVAIFNCTCAVLALSLIITNVGESPVVLWCKAARFLFCIWLLHGSWICLASNTWLLQCTVVLHICSFEFLFLSIPFPIHVLRILNIFPNIILMLCLCNLLPPWYDNSSLICSHFLHDVLVPTSLFLDSMDHCSCLNVEGDFLLYISVQLHLNFKTSSANQVSCCRYAHEWCYLAAERDCRCCSYWVASNGRLTVYGEWRRTGFASVLCWLFNEVCRVNYLCSAER
jgi:hypothetical protein